jgi:ATP-dependent DNA helicase RecG
MALPVNINKLITKSTVEWERKEYKKGWNDEAVIRSMCAFANDINNWGGGYIIIGIAENEGLPVLPPTGLKPGQLDAIQKKLVELCKRLQPEYFPIIEPTVFEEKHILILWCPGGDHRPYSAPVTLGKGSQKEYYIRRGSTTIRASGEDKRRLLEMAAKIPHDDRINQQTEIDDLSYVLIREYLHSIKSKLYESLVDMDLIEIGTNMQIIKGSKEFMRPTNIGLLMFSEKVNEFFPSAYIDVAIYKDSYGTEYEQKIFKGPLHLQLKAALKYLQDKVLTETVKKIEGQAEAERYFNYPYEAIEEALVNALYHRSYENDNQTEVHVRLDKIQIVSYPGAMPPVDNHALSAGAIVARQYRNRRLGEFLKELDLTEGKGTGLPTIRKAMAKNGSPSPIFEMDKDHTYFLTTLEIHPESLQVLSETEILRYCLKSKTRREILVDKLGLSYQTANYERHIEPLIEQGYLQFTIEDKPTSQNQKYLTTVNGREYVKLNTPKKNHKREG